MKTFLAIDFGTSQTSVAMLHESSRYEPEIVEIDGQKTVPTALCLDADGNVLFFGKDAIDKFHDGAGQTFYNFKAFIGKTKDYQSATKQTTHTPESLSLTFMTWLREKVEKKYFNGAKLADQRDMFCVIGCPAEWNEIQKRKVEDIARQAGFPNVTHCEEPLGVIYYYHFRGDLDLSREQNILVYDFGGGTTDVAIERVHADSEGVVGVDVLAASGLTNIGGMCFDRALTDYFIRKLNLDEAALPMRDRQQIERYSRILKEDLSRRVEDGHNSAEVSIPMLRATRGSCTLSVTLDEFNAICAEYIAQFDDPVFDALNFSTLMQDKIDRVILAGGSSALPYVRERITAIFPKGKVLSSMSPTEVIAKGLAVYGRVIANASQTSNPVMPSQPVSQVTPAPEHVREEPRRVMEAPIKKEAPAAVPKHIKEREPKTTGRGKKIWLAVAVLAVVVIGGVVYMQNKVEHEKAALQMQLEQERIARENAEREKAEQERIAREKTAEQAKIEAEKRVQTLNSTYSGKYLGSRFTEEQSAAIRAGTFDGMALGDYWTINGVNWRIADFDYLIRSDKANVDASKHHMMIVTDKPLYNARMNNSNTTSGGYAGSEMRRSGLDQARNMVEKAFGREHILANYGVELMTNEMVFGDGDKSLSLFRVHSDSRAVGEWYWLQDVVSAAYFACVYLLGDAYYGYASYAGGVRPAFAIF